jgi:hypothetical protein
LSLFYSHTQDRHSQGTAVHQGVAQVVEWMRSRIPERDWSRDTWYLIIHAYARIRGSSWWALEAFRSMRRCGKWQRSDAATVNTLLDGLAPDPAVIFSTCASVPRRVCTSRGTCGSLFCAGFGAAVVVCFSQHSGLEKARTSEEDSQTLKGLSSTEGAPEADPQPASFGRALGASLPGARPCSFV